MIALERRACKFGIVRLTFVLLDRLKKFGVTKCSNDFYGGVGDCMWWTSRSGLLFVAIRVT